MATLDQRLASIFEAIVDAYDAQPAEHRRRLLHLRAGGGWEGFNGWGDDQPRVSRDDLDDLHDAGLIDLDFGGSGGYLVKPTREGRQGLRAMRRDQALNVRSEPVDLSWSAVRPVLHASVDTWTEGGAPSAGYVTLHAVAGRLERDPAELDLIRAVEQLGEQGWLEVEYDEDDQIILRPTARGVAATRGWPGGDGEVAAERLLSALDDLLAREPDENKRTKLSRTREFLLDLGSSTLSELAAKAAGGAL